MQKLEFQYSRLHKLSRHILQQEVKAWQHNSKNPSLDCSGYITKRIPFFMYPFKASFELFPKQWKYNEEGNLYWVHDEYKKTVSSGLQFYGLTYNMFYHLFVPGAQQVKLFGGTRLTKVSQPHDVAENIMDLIRFIHLQRN